MKNGGLRAFFEILLPGADKPRARDKAKVNMDLQSNYRNKKWLTKR